jgi:hypothetical protein
METCFVELTRPDQFSNEAEPFAPIPCICLSVEGVLIVCVSAWHQDVGGSWDRRRSGKQLGVAPNDEVKLRAKGVADPKEAQGGRATAVPGQGGEGGARARAERTGDLG